MAWEEIRFHYIPGDQEGTLSLEDIEGILGLVGAEGIYVTSPETITVYCLASSSSAVLHEASDYGLILTSRSEVKEAPWAQQCQELREPLVVGKWTVVPLCSPDEATDPFASNRIEIVVGTGFGTGHHAATRHILHLMEEIPSSHWQDSHVLDFGTGSGILAIAAKKLRASKVDAVDNDEYALQNAKDNIAIHSFTDAIELGLMIPQNSRYGIILANVYAEVLIEYAEVLLGHTEEGAYLALSGIVNESLDSVIHTYKKLGASVVTTRSEGQWSGCLLKKVVSVLE